MPIVRLYQSDAFADRLFAGNPAAVCPLDAWLPEDVMQSIAAENKLSETAFFVGDNGRYHLRWFTPSTELPLCGHATLAAAHVVLTRLAPSLDRVEFDSLSGPLTVTRAATPPEGAAGDAGGQFLTLDFPAAPREEIAVPPRLIEAIGAQPLTAFANDDYYLVLPDAETVASITPDIEALRLVDRRAVAVTAPGDNCDFVSRFFAPKIGVDEDPVTGMIHCTLAPYWGQRLRKTTLHARQLSPRGGTIWCALDGERVQLTGQVVEYLEGSIRL